LVQKLEEMIYVLVAAVKNIRIATEKEKAN
jgi:hypothetical protein